MKLLPTTFRAKLFQLHSLGVVSLIFLRCIVSFLTLCAGKGYYNSIFIFWHDLLDYLRNSSGADSSAAFTDREAQTLFHSYRVDQFNLGGNIITRHNHFYAFG